MAADGVLRAARVASDSELYFSVGAILKVAQGIVADVERAVGDLPAFQLELLEAVRREHPVKDQPLSAFGRVSG